MALGLTGGHDTQDLRRVPGTCVFLYPQAWEVPNMEQGWWGGRSLDLAVVAPHRATSSGRHRSQSSCLTPPPWPFASEPRLEGPWEAVGRIGDPHRRSKRAEGQSQGPGVVTTLS